MRIVLAAAVLSVCAAPAWAGGAMPGTRADPQRPSSGEPAASAPRAHPAAVERVALIPTGDTAPQPSRAVVREPAQGDAALDENEPAPASVREGGAAAQDVSDTEVKASASSRSDDGPGETEAK